MILVFAILIRLWPYYEAPLVLWLARIYSPMAASLLWRTLHPHPQANDDTDYNTRRELAGHFVGEGQSAQLAWAGLVLLQYETRIGAYPAIFPWNLASVKIEDGDLLFIECVDTVGMVVNFGEPLTPIHAHVLNKDRWLVTQATKTDITEADLVIIS